MNPRTAAQLARRHPELGRVIRASGPIRIAPQARQSPFAALVRSIVYQQLTGRAAATILKRVRGIFPAGAFPAPEKFLSVPEATYRGAGLSRAKTAAIQDLARQAIAGVVPTSRAIAKMGDEEIIARLTQIRGVGRWTVEMLLIFKLGRPDVWPAGDYGVRKGFALTYGLAELPTAKELLAAGDRFRPHRTTAAWYFWRATEVLALPKTAKARPPAKPAKAKPRSKKR